MRLSCGSLAYYTFCRIHKSLRVTPAMEAGITVWELSELLILMPRSWSENDQDVRLGSIWILVSESNRKFANAPFGRYQTLGQQQW
jgi:hypothetical protein